MLYRGYGRWGRAPRGEWRASRIGWGRPQPIRSTCPGRRKHGRGPAQTNMPRLGESGAAGRGDQWMKKGGDVVKRDEPIVEVVTDKVSAEIPSPFEGKLVKITAAQGETVLVGSVIAQIEVAGTPSAPAAPAAPPAPGAKPDPTPAAVSSPAAMAAAA